MSRALSLSPVSRRQRTHIHTPTARAPNTQTRRTGGVKVMCLWAFILKYMYRIHPFLLLCAQKPSQGLCGWVISYRYAAPAARHPIRELRPSCQYTKECGSVCSVGNWTLDRRQCAELQALKPCHHHHHCVSSSAIIRLVVAIISIVTQPEILGARSCAFLVDLLLERIPLSSDNTTNTITHTQRSHSENCRQLNDSFANKCFFLLHFGTIMQIM